MSFAGQRSPVMRVSSDGGTPSPITSLDEKNGEVSAARKWLVSTNGGIRPVWSRSARELFYLQSTGTNRLTDSLSVMTVPYATAQDAFMADRPRAWSANPFPASTFAFRLDFDLTPDGKRVLAIMPIEGASSGESPGVTFLLNFADELRRNVPSR